MTGSRTVLSITLRMLSLLIAVSILAFLLIALAPIDPLTAYIGPESTLSQEAKDVIAEHWGLNKSLPERYFSWVTNMVRLDFGESLTFKKPVIDIIGERAGASLILMIFVWIFSGLIGFGLGVLAGVRRKRILDRIIKLFCLILQSSPVFWLGLMMLSIFSVMLGWFPIGMAAPLGKMEADITLWDRIYHLILPVFTLSIASAGKIALFTRQKYVEIMDSNFILYARARGESGRTLVLRHGLRNVALPAITLQFASFSELFGGMTLAETVFSYPGIGSAMTTSALKGDVPLLLGTTLFSALFVFAGNLTANLLYGVLDPRMKEEGGRHV